MSLDTYRRKRDFAKTPEPSGSERAGKPPKAGRRFVVQRHRATRLHYDFRLEIDGVLMSWAVPRGPSLNPADRRMAVHVEDHPISYFDFEGVIPKGEYGGGDVIVWDWGTFEPEETDDPGKAVRSGELKLRLHGEKLRGRFTLVKTRGYQSGQDDWLLIHKKDEDADATWDVDAYPQSVKTGRTNDEVLAGADAVWDSKAPAEVARIDLAGAERQPLPEFVAPMAATAVDKPFSDEDWLFELKLDGYRIEAIIDGPSVKLWTRNKQDAARYFPELAKARPTWINAEDAIVDGEVVALDEAGRPAFSLLQDRAGMGRFGPRGVETGSRKPTRDPKFIPPVVYYAFDLIYHNGQLLTDVPLDQRKRLLQSVLREHPLVRFGSHIERDGEEFYEIVRKQGLEGIVAKLRNSPYEPGRRSRSWLKIKIRREQDRIYRQAYKEGRRETPGNYAADAFAALVTGQGLIGDKSKSKGAEVVVLVSREALLRGEVDRGAGELCEVPGFGSIPVSRAKEMLADCFLKGVLVDGKKVVTVKHFGRHRPAELDTALLVRSVLEHGRVICIVEGCDHTARIQWDHAKAWARGGATAEDNLNPMCGFDNREKEAGRVIQRSDGRWVRTGRAVQTRNPP